jgi:hypothetical protein
MEYITSRGLGTDVRVGAGPPTGPKEFDRL